MGKIVVESSVQVIGTMWMEYTGDSAATLPVWSHSLQVPSWYLGLGQKSRKGPSGQPGSSQLILFQGEWWRPLPEEPCGTLDSIMVTGQATALATSCVCMSVGASLTLPWGPPSHERVRAFHRYKNEQGPQICSDAPEVTQWWQVTFHSIRKKCWQPATPAACLASGRASETRVAGQGLAAGWHTPE